MRSLFSNDRREWLRSANVRSSTLDDRRPAFLQHQLASQRRQDLSQLWRPIVAKNRKHTGCNRRNGPDFGRAFLMLYYTDITQNAYVQSWTVTEIMAREKCGLLVDPSTVPVSWQSYPCPPLSVGSCNSSSAHARLYRNARSVLLRHSWAVICHVYCLET